MSTLRQGMLAGMICVCVAQAAFSSPMLYTFDGTVTGDIWDNAQFAAAAGVTLGYEFQYHLIVDLDEAGLNDNRFMGNIFYEDEVISDVNAYGTIDYFYAELLSTVMTGDENSYANEFRWGEQQDIVSLVFDPPRQFYRHTIQVGDGGYNGYAYIYEAGYVDEIGVDVEHTMVANWEVGDLFSGHEMATSSDDRGFISSFYFELELVEIRPVPEPASLWLLGLAAGGLAAGGLVARRWH